MAGRRNRRPSDVSTSTDGSLTEATLDQTAAVLWVIIVIVVIPWRHVISQYVLARGERWR